MVTYMAASCFARAVVSELVVLIELALEQLALFLFCLARLCGLVEEEQMCVGLWASGRRMDYRQVNAWKQTGFRLEIGLIYASMSEDIACILQKDIHMLVRYRNQRRS